MFEKQHGQPLCVVIIGRIKLRRMPTHLLIKYNLGAIHEVVKYNGNTIHLVLKK